MRHQILLTAACAGLTLACVLASPFGAVQPQPDVHQPPDAAPAQPGGPTDNKHDDDNPVLRPQHRWLARTAGRFAVKVTVYPESGGEPLVLDAAATREMMLGGRFLLERIECTDARAPFTAISIYGFNADARLGPRYEIVRYSSMSPCTMPEEGRWDEQSHTLASAGEHEMGGMTARVRTICQFESDVRFISETFVALEGFSDDFRGVKVPEYLAMAMTFERVTEEGPDERNR